MLNSLDLLVIVFMVLVAVGLLSICLMFLVRNPKIKKVSFYIVALLGMYMSTVAFRINWPLFMGQAIIGIVLGLLSVVAVVMERMSKDDVKKFEVARMLVTASAVLGIVNAFFI